MADPAAVLSIIVRANTAAANANLAKTDAQLRGTAAAASASTAATSRSSSAMRKLGTAAKVGGAALGVGFVVAAKKSVATTQELTKGTILLHKNLGLSNKQASEWAGLAKARGADTTKLGMAFKTLSTQIVSARSGSEASVQMFKQLGLSQKEVQRASHDTSFAVKAVADGLDRLPAGADKAAISGKLFGRGWQTIAPILRDGSAAMQEQLDTVEKYGGVLEGKTLKQQKNLIANLRENKIAWQGMQITLASAVTPALNAVSRQFNKIAAITANKDLTGEEKFKRIADILQRDFEKALEVIVQLIPEIASRVGAQAPKIAIALVEGFLKANVWGKLLIGSWLIRKFGASSMLAAGGKKMGLILARAFVTSALGSMILEKLGLAAILGPNGELKLIGSGTKAGAIFGRAFGAGAIAALVIAGAEIVTTIDNKWGPQINKGFKNVQQSMRQLADKFGPIGHLLAQPFRLVTNSVKGMWHLIRDVAHLIDDLVHGRWSKIWGDLKKIALDQLRAIKAGLKIILTPARLVFNWFKDHWSQLGHIIGAPFRWAWQAIKDVFAFIRAAPGKAVDAIKDKWSGIRAVLTAPFRAVKSVAQDVFGWLRDKIQWVLDKVNFVKDKVNSIQNLPGVPGGGGGGILGTGIGNNPFNAAGGLVTRYMAGGGGVGLPKRGTDTQPAMLTPGEFVMRKAAVDKIGAGALDAMNKGHTEKNSDGLQLEGKSGKKLIDEARKVSRKTAEVITEEISKGHDEASGDTKKFVDKHGKQIDDLRDNSKRITQRYRENTIQDFRKTSGEATDATTKMRANVTDRMQATRENATQQSGKMKTGVVGDYRSMASAASAGIQKLGAATNKALKALGVKPVQFGVVEEGQSQGGGGNGHQRGGHIFGSGEGDTVSAMLEPGEFVVNRKAAAKHRKALEAINFRDAPRFQKGGAVGGGMGAMIREVDKFESHHFPYSWGGGHGGFGVQPVDCSGFVSDILHTAGLLNAPMVSGSLMSWGKSGKGPLTVYASPEHTVLSLNGKFAGTSGSNPGGGAGWIEGGSPSLVSGGVARTMEVTGGIVKQIKRLLMKGTGAPRDMGQAALDKVHGAAQKYIDAHTPAGGFGGGQVSIQNLPASLEKYNHLWKQLAPGGGGGPTMPLNKIAELAEFIGGGGVPGKTMAQVTIGESGSRPGAWGIDPGGATRGYGLWAITTGVGNDAMINRFGGPSQMFNPIVNAQAMAEIYKGSGIGAWYGTGSVTSTNAHYTGPMKKAGGFIGEFHRGGQVAQDGFGLLQKGETVIPKLQKGGHAKKGKGPAHPFDVLNWLPDFLHRFLPTSSWGGAAQREFHKLHRIKESPAFKRMSNKEQTAVLDRLKELRERRKLTREQQRQVRQISRHGGPQQLQNAIDLIKKFGTNFGKDAQKRLEDLRMQRRHHNLSQKERRELHQLERRKDRERAQERRVEELQHRIALERTLIGQNEALIKEQAASRKELQAIRAGLGAALPAVSDWVSADIGAKGLQKSRQAGAGRAVTF